VDAFGLSEVLYDGLQVLPESLHAVGRDCGEALVVPRDHDRQALMISTLLAMVHHAIRPATGKVSEFDVREQPLRC